MEILVAVIAFAGALLAAVAAGALIQRLRDDPEGWLIAWTVAVVSLCLSLGVIGIGGVLGFGGFTFRIYQVTGSLLAPLWLGVGLVQLLAEKVPPRFLAWLFGTALTVVAAAIMVFDPLKSDDMSRTLPAAADFWGLIPGYLLIGVHVIAVLLMLAMLVVAGLKWRNGDEYDTDNLHASLVIVPSGMALVGAMRFAVPPLFTTALLLVAAAAVWYTVLRPLAPYEDDDEDDFAPDREERVPRRDDRSQRREEALQYREEPSMAQMPPGERPMYRDERVGRRGVPEPMPAPDLPPSPPPRRASGLGDLVAEYRAGDQEVDYAARMAAPPEGGPATGYIMSGGPGQRPDYGMPATGVVYPGADVFSPAPKPAPQPVPQPVPQPAPQQQPASSRPLPTIYGLLTVFTIMDGAGDAFDRLAEATVEAVRRGEPDTLVYACHAVKSAPLQRIVYELYRDEVAYRDHQRQPHVERFVNERQAMVLATNVIELNVNAAKVVPLPTAMF
ncbi:putative quinol monooxygenase [Nonomuraea jiangxiensis]|uniref:Quinol monooxygenase YgiN n=1 Tax=Nonomuraea jiangxiensis TaxID=633440 RepID=A0A1G9L6B3_9ACTN|nr:antibiotic biosynthesis monooxygenase [Nonomuraea jiangxiensis]SDL57510.1 Quinol monooxygenase YgiN [Nonomuraea jiangxiensis]